MALRNAVLAALVESEASGYDLAKNFDIGVSNFWTCTPQQLYRELDRMVADGLITPRLVRQHSRPDKRLYSMTDAGRDALRAFISRTPKPTAMRNELLVQVAAMDAGNLADTRAAIAHQLATSERKLGQYNRSREHLLNGLDQDVYLRTAPHVGPYLTLLRGIDFERENIRWCRLVLKAVDARRDRHPSP